jgi:putative phage-type endonuclease
MLHLKTIVKEYRSAVTFYNSMKFDLNKLVELNPEIRFKDLEWVVDNPPIRSRNDYVRQLGLKVFKEVPTKFDGKLKNALAYAKTLLDSVFEAAGPELKKSLKWQRRVNRILATEESTDQRTIEWFMKRARAITGSMVHQVLKSPATRFAAMVKKLKPEERSPYLCDAPAACRHGIIFEDIVKEVFCKWHGVTLGELGCINHREHPWLAASPDGYINCNGVPLDQRTEKHGRLIEIKCPLTRPKKDGYIPEEYLCQMYMQMECVGVDECEFIEFWIDGDLGTYNTFLETPIPPGMAKGYYYMDMEMKTVRGWKVFMAEPTAAERAEIERLLTDNAVYFWVLKDHQNQLVKHDPTWLPTNMPVLRGFMEELEMHRARGTIPEIPPELQQKRASKTKTTLDLTTDVLEILDIQHPRKKRRQENTDCLL